MKPAKYKFIVGAIAVVILILGTIVVIVYASAGHPS